MEPNECVTAEVMVSIHGVPLKLTLSIPAKPVRARTMLPLFQQLSDTYVNYAARLIEKAGQQVSCKMGCAACCRQVVALAEVEVYHIAELVRNLPEPRRTEIQTRFERAVARLDLAGWFEELDACREAGDVRQAALNYYSQNIDCPFLEGELCSIYETRPIACREYVVTSPMEHCSDPEKNSLRMLPLFLNASDGVRRISRSANLGKKSVVPLVKALQWTEQYPEGQEEKTGGEWLGNFFGKEGG